MCIEEQLEFQRACKSAVTCRVQLLWTVVHERMRYSLCDIIYLSVPAELLQCTHCHTHLSKLILMERPGSASMTHSQLSESL